MFENILQIEEQLLGIGDEDDSDFEKFSPKKYPREADDGEEKEVEEDEESLEKHITRFVTSRIRKIHDSRGRERKTESKDERRKEMEKVLLRERQTTNVEMDLKIKECIAGVRQYVDEEVLKLRQYVDERFEALVFDRRSPNQQFHQRSRSDEQNDPISSHNLQLVLHTPLGLVHSSPPILALTDPQIVEERSMIKAIKGRPDRKRRIGFSPTQNEFSFPGRSMVSSTIRNQIDHVMQLYPNR